MTGLLLVISYIIICFFIELKIRDRKEIDKYIKNIISLLFTSSVLFFNNSISMNIDIEIIPFIRISLDKLQLYAILFISVVSISVFNNVNIYKKYIYLVYFIIINLIISIAGLGPVSLLLPSLLFMFEVDIKNIKSFKIMLITSWITFILHENIQSVNLDSLLYLIFSISFYVLYFQLYKLNKKTYPLLSITSLFILFKSISFLESTGSLVKLLIFVFGSYYVLSKYGKLRFYDVILLFLPSLIHFLNFMDMSSQNILIILTYTYITQMILRSKDGIEEHILPIVSLFCLLMFSINPMSPFFLILNNGTLEITSEIIYLICMMSMLIIGLMSQKYINQIIKINKKNIENKWSYLNIMYPITVLLLYFLYLVFYKYEVNFIEHQNYNVYIISLISLMAFFLGILLTHTIKGSQYISYEIVKYKFMVLSKTNYPLPSFRWEKRFFKRKNRLDLKEFISSYLNKGENEKNYELIFFSLFSILFLILWVL